MLEDGKSIGSRKSRTVVEIGPTVKSTIRDCVVVVVTVRFNIQTVVVNGVVVPRTRRFMDPATAIVIVSCKLDEQDRLLVTHCHGYSPEVSAE